MFNWIGYAQDLARDSYWEAEIHEHPPWDFMNHADCYTWIKFLVGQSYGPPIEVVREGPDAIPDDSEVLDPQGGFKRLLLDYVGRTENISGIMDINHLTVRDYRDWYFAFITNRLVPRPDRIYESQDLVQLRTECRVFPFDTEAEDMQVDLAQTYSWQQRVEAYLSVADEGVIRIDPPWAVFTEYEYYILMSLLNRNVLSSSI